MTTLEKHFDRFRKNVVGYQTSITTPYGKKPLIYADWIASGRLYHPIEQAMLQTFGPLIGNTHTETNITGTTMTLAYENAKKIIKNHVGADAKKDVLLLTGSGMTGAINKFIRLLGWRVHERYKRRIRIPLEEKPVVFTTIMEHHSNDVAWRESIAEVVYIPHEKSTLLPDLSAFKTLLKRYKNRKYKVASISACSNVTGIQPNYHRIAKIMHQHGGYCFVDFAASAPYVEINMRPNDPLEQLDAIFFSPHKFVGGPGTSGVLLFDKRFYKNQIPDHPGGGTVKWVNCWGEQNYWDRLQVKDIEAREDGGTPPFLQGIKIALCLLLKEQMGTKQIAQREQELLEIVFPTLRKISNLRLLNDNVEERLGVLSFYLKDKPIAYNLMVQLLNDHYGIQVRGGCACAGPYGHFLLDIDRNYSKRITNEIDLGDTSSKPGWVRLSLHPLMTNSELYYILDAIKTVAEHFEELKNDYLPIPSSNAWRHKDYKPKQQILQLEQYFSSSRERTLKHV